jgi:uncharacterized protein
MTIFKKFQNFDLKEFIDKKEEIYGKIPLNNFDRLKSFDKNESSIVEIVINCISNHGQNFLNLTINVNLFLSCFRCLDSFDYNLTITDSYEIVRKNEPLEPHKIDNIKIELSAGFNLLEFIEDEILLSLPSSPKHEVDCIN